MTVSRTVHLASLVGLAAIAAASPAAALNGRPNHEGGHELGPTAGGRIYAASSQVA
jgi:hypothetical protein